MPKINQEEYEVLKGLREKMVAMIIPLKFDVDGYDNSVEIHGHNEYIVGRVLMIDELIEEYEELEE